MNFSAFFSASNTVQEKFPVLLQLCSSNNSEGRKAAEVILFKCCNCIFVKFQVALMARAAKILFGL